MSNETGTMSCGSRFSMLKYINKTFGYIYMINEKKYLAEHPLKIWKSDEVTRLLIDFFRANFVKGGLPQELAEELVLKAWQGKYTKDSEGVLKYF